MIEGGISEYNANCINQKALGCFEACHWHETPMRINVWMEDNMVGEGVGSTENIA